MSAKYRLVGLTSVLFMSSALSFELVDERKKPGSFIADAEYPRDWLVAASANWMAELPDETPLNRISIPGTHDTAAFIGGFFCQTQVWNITAQLKAGIRSFDIRNRAEGDEFALYHGICFLDLFFDSVMDQIQDFLKESPGETLLMRVKEEIFPANGSLSFSSIWARYMQTYHPIVVPDVGEQIPTLGQVRGRVLVFRDAPFAGYGLKWEGPSTDTQDFYEIKSPSGDSLFGGDNGIPLEKKKEFIEEYLRKAKTSPLIVFNHLSGSGGLSPATVANATLKFTYDKLGQFKEPTPSGVLVMDYPGDRQIHRIIKTNFAAIRQD